MSPYFLYSLRQKVSGIKVETIGTRADDGRNYSLYCKVCFFLRDGYNLFKHYSIEEHFRDACQQGDLETVKRVLASLNQRETDLLLHSQSTCTGTPLFDAIISHVSFHS